MVGLPSMSSPSSSQLPGYGGYRPFYVRQKVTEAIGERQRHSRLSLLHLHHTQPPPRMAATTYQQHHQPSIAALHTPLPARTGARQTQPSATEATHASEGSSGWGDSGGDTAMATTTTTAVTSTSTSTSEYSSSYAGAQRRSVSAPSSSASTVDLHCSARSSAAPSLHSLPFAANLLRSAAAYDLYTRHSRDYQPPHQLLLSHLSHRSGCPSPPLLSSLMSTRDLLDGTSKVSDGRRLPGYEGHQPNRTQRSSSAARS